MIFLDRVDAVPILNEDSIDMQLMQWFWVLVDVLNENIADIQNSFNLLQGQSYTQDEITDLQNDNRLADGVILYDITNNVYVGRQNGLLVQFNTSAYP